MLNLDFHLRMILGSRGIWKGEVTSYLNITLLSFTCTEWGRQPKASFSTADYPSIDIQQDDDNPTIPHTVHKL